MCLRMAAEPIQKEYRLDLTRPSLKFSVLKVSHLTFTKCDDNFPVLGHNFSRALDHVEEEPPVLINFHFSSNLQTLRISSFLIINELYVGKHENDLGKIHS